MNPTRTASIYAIAALALAGVTLLAGCADRKYGMRADGAWGSSNTKYTGSEFQAAQKIRGASINAKGSQDPDEEAIRATGDAVAKPIEAGAKAARPTPTLPDPFRGQPQ